MTYFELFQQGPKVFVPILFLSLIATAFSYSVIPITFALLRNSEITKKKYICICYGFNIIIIFVFVLLYGGLANCAPYFLWTYFSTTIGTKILMKKNVIKGSICDTECDNLNTSKEAESCLNKNSTNTRDVKLSISKEDEKNEYRDEVPLSYLNWELKKTINQTTMIECKRFLLC